ncbi:Crp/Fnr family transcriptional regulator [Rickettsiales bacterium]|nr:Crp/Fnr family transcriptional regulator [Rickettsiales bacterium]
MSNIIEKPNVKELSGNSESYRNFLKSIPLFSDFPEDAISQVLGNARIKKYNKNEILFMTGDKAENFRIIITGWAKLYRQTRDGHEAIVTVLTNGEMFGNTAIIKNGTHAYTAETVADSIMFLIPASFMLHMSESYQHFDHFLAKFLEGGLGQSTQLSMNIEHLSQMTSAQRVGCFLLRLCLGQKEGSISLQLPYEKGLVAGRLGMTAETFSRSLSHLITYGVETDHSIVTIHNIMQLRRYICEHCSATTRECHLGEDMDEY